MRLISIPFSSRFGIALQEEEEEEEGDQDIIQLDLLHAEDCKYHLKKRNESHLKPLNKKLSFGFSDLLTLKNVLYSFLKNTRLLARFAPIFY